MSVKALVDEILKDAWKWDRKYLEVTVHAIRRFNTEGDAEDLIDEFLAQSTAGQFNLANPYSKGLFLAELLPTLITQVTGRFNDPSQSVGMSCALATFLRPEWNCAEGSVDFDIAAAKKVIRNALTGFDFIARFEPVTYQNEFHGLGGRRAPLVCFHCHCIIWTTASYSKLERLRKTLKHRFGGKLERGDGPHFARLETARDVAKSAGYMSKMPALGKRTGNRVGERRQSSRKISYRSYFATFNELRKHDMYTFWLSGGDGAKLLRDARRRLVVDYDEFGPRQRDQRKTRGVESKRRGKRKYNP